MQLAPLNLYVTPQIPHAASLESTEPLKEVKKEDQWPISAVVDHAMSGVPHQRITKRSLTPIMTLAANHLFDQPMVASKRKNQIGHSFVMLPGEGYKRLFVSTQDRLPETPQDAHTIPSMRLRVGTMITFGPGNQLQVKRMVKRFAHYPRLEARTTPELITWCAALDRRLAALRELSGPFPKTAAVITYEGKNGRMLAIFEEYFDKDLQTLYDQTLEFRTLSYPVRLSLALQAVLAVKHMHKAGWVHRDIKLANFLLDTTDGYRLVLTDFGEAVRTVDRDTLNVPHGTLTWMAPEGIYKSIDPKSVGTPGQAADIWSLGLLLYALAGFTHFSIATLDKWLTHTEKISFFKRHKNALQEVLQHPKRFDMALTINGFIKLLEREENELQNSYVPFESALNTFHLCNHLDIARALPQKNLILERDAIHTKLGEIVIKKAAEIVTCKTMQENLKNAPPDRLMDVVVEYDAFLKKVIANHEKEADELLDDWKTGIQNVKHPDHRNNALLKLAISLLNHEPEKRASFEAIERELEALP